MCETSESDNTIIKDLGLVKTQILLVQLTLVIHKVIRMNITLANSKNTSYTIIQYHIMLMVENLVLVAM